MTRRLLAGLTLLMGVFSISTAQPVQWVGNTALYNTGLGQIPTKASYIEKWHSVTVVAQTWPIAPGQTVSAVVTTNNWLSSQEYVFTYDYNVGNNSQWYRVLGPFPPGTDVQFYIRANGQNNSVVYDNNATQNFGFYTRYSPPRRREPILQWFETDYRTMLKRLPEVVNAGYGAIYLPPPTKSGGGTFSVGYNPFDRFDLGDRLSLGTVRTKYGTSQELVELIRTAKKFGLEVYCDLVFNHSDNRANTAINRYPDTIPEDYHIKSSTDTSNTEINFNNESAFSFGMLNHDLIGLADIAHEDGNNTRTGTFTLPSYATFNNSGKPSFIRHPRNPQYYPTGTPAQEDVRQYLLRWSWFLSNQYGFDGYRLDAVKHTPPAFFDNALGQPGSPSSNAELLPYLYGVDPNCYVFAENFTSNAYELREFTKTGMNMLDFPLKFNLDNLFNSNGFGSLSQSLSNAYGLDPATGLAYEKGGLGRDLSVAFVQSHDQGPPTSNNLAYAFALTRVGRTKVYYDGNNIQPGNWANFPRPGRADAIGTGTDLLTRIVDAAARFGRGDQVNRWTDDHLYVYERQVSGYGVLLVGLNNRGDQVEMSALVQTGFAAGTVLVDLSGQKPNLTVDALGKVTIVVPANTDANSVNNARGYVLYAPQTPSPIDPAKPVRLLDAVTGSEYAFISESLPAGTYGQSNTFKAATVTNDLLNLSVQTNSLGDSAWVKFDDGLSFDGLVPAQNTSEELTDGYIAMTKTANGNFALNAIDLSAVPAGLHLARVRVFTNAGNRPPVFSEFRAFFYVKRVSGITVDGDLTDLGNPIVTQSRVPSSQSNRLDALYLANDDKYLYIGIAGNVDSSEGLTNGISMFIDTDPTQATGLRTFGSLDDDSGPAARLLSNATVNAPNGFGAEFGIGVLRRSTMGSAAGTSFVGDPVLTPTIGAFAGLFRVDGVNPAVLGPRTAALGWQPRAAITDPPKGMEVAIPLNQLCAPSVTTGAALGFVSYLGTTGESGQTLVSTNAARGTYGGFGQPQSYLTNQFLPVQPVQNDPGFGSVNLSSYSYFNLKFATKQPKLLPLQTTNWKEATGLWQGYVVLMNRSGQTLQGPFSLRLSLPGGVKLLNRTGMSFREPTRPYITIEGTTIPPNGQVKVPLHFQVPNGITLSPAFETFTGRGIL